MADDRSKPDFNVSVDGSPISSDLVSALLQLTVDDTLNAAGYATLRFRDEETKVSSSHPFKVGAKVEIKLGYVADANHVVFKGEVTGYKGAFLRRGNAQFTVIAHDQFHRLRRNRRCKSFLQMKDSDVISAVASEAGLTADVKATKVTHDTVQQFNQTDADFVLERANLVGHVVYVDDKKLVSKPPELSGSSVATLEWHKELRSFDVSIDTAEQQKKVAVKAWDMVAKELIEFTAEGKERNLMGGTEPGAKAAAPLDGTEPKTRVWTPASSAEEVELYATSQFQWHSERFLQGSGTCEGDPQIRRGTVIELESIGEYLSGPFFVNRAVHTLLGDSGYTTTFYVLRTATQRPGAAPTAELPPPEQAEPFTAENEGDPLSFEVGDSAGAPLGGTPVTLVDPHGNRQATELSSDGKVEIEFEE